MSRLRYYGTLVALIAPPLSVLIAEWMYRQGWWP